MKRKWWLLCAMLMAALIGGYYSTRAIAEPNEIAPMKAKLVNEVRVKALLDEMRDTDLDKLAALEVKPLELPGAGIDVMRVRLEETYDIEGIGKDTVELKGWIAVKHDHTRPANGEDELTWSNAITDTEFVGMELHGESPVFGPVRVTLDKTQPSVGQVGRLSLPFAVGSLLDASYRPYRTPLQIDRAAANRVQGRPSIALAAERKTPSSKAAPSLIVTGVKARPVLQVIDGVLKAVSAKDPEAMLRFYSPSGDNLFFGPADKSVTRGSQDYIRGVSRAFSSVKAFESKRNDDVQVRISGKLATATLTGINNVVDAQGQRGSSPWRWTVELERGRGDAWLITHDHISFFQDVNQPIDKALSNADLAAKCEANVSASLRMDDLDLDMRTAVPVQWYSEVNTIPPVGTVASVSLAPTPLIADDRQVGMLEHGAVKFREVVRHVPLIDVPRSDLRVATVRTSSRTGGR